MAEKELLDKIEFDAKSRANDLIADAKIKAGELLASAQAEANNLTNLVREKVAKLAPDMLKRRLSGAELEVKKMVLEEKQAKISSVYAQASDAIIADARYARLLQAMIESACDDGDEIVFSAQDTKKLNVAEIVEKASQKSNNKLSLSKETGAFKGGVMIKSKGYDKNLTLEIELANSRDNNAKIAGELFK